MIAGKVKSTEPRSHDSGKEDIPTEQMPVVPNSRAVPDLPTEYEGVEEIGRGGNGVVYQARVHRGIDDKDELVAIKVLPGDKKPDEDSVKRFIAEGYALSSLRDSNICGALRAGVTTRGLLYIEMEYCNGGTLRREITEKNGDLDLGRAVGIAISVASGLVAAHEHRDKIIHRDIKPENIMFKNSKTVITDWGLAKLLEKPSATCTSGFIGTPPYCSLEQLQCHPADPRMDIWSLGVVMYEMITGRIPFAGSVVDEVVKSIQEHDFVPIEKTRPRVPAGLLSIVNKALKKNLVDRYQTAREMLEDLKRIDADYGRSYETYAVLEALEGDTVTGHMKEVIGELHEWIAKGAGFDIAVDKLASTHGRVRRGIVAALSMRKVEAVRDLVRARVAVPSVPQAIMDSLIEALLCTGGDVASTDDLQALLIVFPKASPEIQKEILRAVHEGVPRDVIDGYKKAVLSVGNSDVVATAVSKFRSLERKKRELDVGFYRELLLRKEGSAFVKERAILELSAERSRQVRKMLDDVLRADRSSLEMHKRGS